MVKPRLLAKTLLAQLRLWRGALRRKRALGVSPDGLVILMYHRVLPEQDIGQSCSSRHIIIDEQDFERQMALLVRKAVPFALEEALERRRNGLPLPVGAVAVTFDDGWADNARYAWPILQKYGVPATIFLATDYIGSGRVFWQERLRFLLRHPSFQELSAQDRARLGLPDTVGAPEAVVEELKLLPAHQAQAVVGRLEKALGQPEFPREAHAMLTWEQVRELKCRCVSFGSHGTSHAIFTGLPLERVEHECVASREKIASELGDVPRTLAYPNGDWTPEIARRVRAAGYELALTTQVGVNSGASDLFALRRFNVSLPMFQGPGGGFSTTRFLVTLCSGM